MSLRAVLPPRHRAHPHAHTGGRAGSTRPGLTRCGHGGAARSPDLSVLRRGVLAAFGPFTEYLGSEREHSSGPSSPGGSRLFCHRTHSTVGTTLRMVGDRMLNRDGGRVSGLVILPSAPDAQWWKLTRHMAAVALLPAGRSASHLECNRLGRCGSLSRLNAEA